MTEQHFEKNLQLFEYKNPRAVALLSCVEIDSTNPLHLPDIDGWIRALPLAQTEVLVVFGIGQGEVWRALHLWKKTYPAAKLVFLEDDLSAVGRFLETECATELLHDLQTEFYYIEDSQEGVEVLKALAWATFAKRMQIVASPDYQMRRKEVFEEVKARLLYEASDIHAVCDEYTNFGISYFRNFWQNLFLLPGSYLGNKLLGQFQGIPAIVVAAGPSLKKQLPLLQELRHQALIFAGGSSVNALTEAGIFPHFGGGIDPNPLQYMRLRQSLAFEIPYFFRSRMLHEAAELISGPRLYLRGGDGYNLAEYFEKKAKIRGKVLGGGHSIANFGVEIAYALGCSPIILVGFDLAYGASDEHYAPGIEESHPSSVHKGRETDCIDWKDHEDRPIRTAWKWVLEGQWIEEFAEKHGKKRFINATEGGLGIRGIRHMALEEVTSQFLSRSYDLDGLIHHAIQEAGTCSTLPKTLLSAMSALFDSLSRCIESIDALLDAIKNGRGSDAHPMEGAEAVMCVAKLEQEDAFTYILDVFHRMKTKFDFYTMQFRDSAVRSTKDRRLLETDLLAEHYFFLKEVAIVNQAMIRKTVLQQQGKGLDIAAFTPKISTPWLPNEC